MSSAAVPPARRRLGPALVVLLVGGAALGVALRADLAEAPPRSERFALSPQECNTECQSRQTDCIDACDGNASCERRCVDAGLACVERCKRLGADAGVGGGSAGGAGGGSNAGRGGNAGSGGNAGRSSGGAPGSAGAAGRGGAQP